MRSSTPRFIHLLLISFALYLIIPTIALRAQENARPLKPGESVPGVLEKKGKSVFSVDLKEGQFVYGEVNQITVDVVITVKNPAGGRVGVFDNPARGPEPFQVNTDTSGTYTIEVTPFREESGKFAIEVKTIEPIAATPEGRIDQVMARYNKPDFPGGVVAVERHGKIVIEKGYGLANVEYGIPNTPTTPFHMASVSKQFTAFAIVMLAEQGKLSLDDDVHKYIPELHDFGKKITLRHLLNHTSGLRDQWNLWSMSGQRMDDVIRQQDLMTLMANQTELNFTPGDEMLYCNSGYMLLSETVARVSGMPFREFMKKNVFDPLGMHDTQIYDDHQRIMKGRAYSYRNGDDGIDKAVLSYANSGATSLFSTAEDLCKWLDNWRTAKVGGREALDQMQVRGILNNGDTLSYALGVGIGTYQGQRQIAHSGGDAGYRTYVAYYPDIDVGVVALGNYGSFDPSGIAHQAVEATFGDLFRAEQPPPASPPSQPEEKKQPWKPASRDLEKLAGRYYSPELETFYTVTSQDTVLVAYQRRLGDVTLTPATEKNHFDGSQFALQNVEFVPDKGEMLVSNGRVRNLKFRKVNWK